VHFKTYNPDDQVRGSVASGASAADDPERGLGAPGVAAMWSERRAPVDDGHVAEGPVSDVAFERVKAQINGLHKGVDNWGKIAILEEG
jgi:hypothetical protein